MNSFEYLKSLSGPDAESLAERAETKRVYLSQIAYGHRRAGPLLARRLEALTAGKVKSAELRPDVFGPAIARQEDHA